jgi:hypothetical protein
LVGKKTNRESGRTEWQSGCPLWTGCGPISLSHRIVISSFFSPPIPGLNRQMTTTTHGE